jgi:hypothetical protein
MQSYETYHLEHCEGVIIDAWRKKISKKDDLGDTGSNGGKSNRGHMG